MGLSARKSFKIGKNTRINLSKNGGIGISTGVKGARVSMNKQGIRTQVGKGGISYRKQVGWDKINTTNNKPIKSNTKQVNILELPMGVEQPPTPKIIRNLMLISIGCLIASAFFILLLPVAFILLIVDLGMLLFSKKFKNAYCTQQAIRNYKARQFDLCEKYCYKALKYEKDNNSARILLENI